MENGQNMLQTVANTVENTMENERFELKTVAHTVEMAVSSSKMLQIAWENGENRKSKKKIPKLKKKNPNNFLPFNYCYQYRPLWRPHSTGYVVNTSISWWDVLHGIIPVNRWMAHGWMLGNLGEEVT